MKKIAAGVAATVAAKVTTKATAKKVPGIMPEAAAKLCLPMLYS
jgi:hypothetical protein